MCATAAPGKSQLSNRGFIFQKGKHDVGWVHKRSLGIPLLRSATLALKFVSSNQEICFQRKTPLRCEAIPKGLMIPLTGQA